MHVHFDAGQSLMRGATGGYQSTPPGRRAGPRRQTHGTVPPTRVLFADGEGSRARAGCLSSTLCAACMTGSAPESRRHFSHVQKVLVADKGKNELYCVRYGLEGVSKRGPGSENNLIIRLREEVGSQWGWCGVCSRFSMPQSLVEARSATGDRCLAVYQHQSCPLRYAEPSQF